MGYVQYRCLGCGQTRRVGRVETDSDGSLYAIPTGNRPCRVELSDGTQLTLEASAPSPLTFSGAWKLTAAAEDGVGLEAAAEIELDRLPSWRDIRAIHTFAGTATYATQFTLAVDSSTGAGGIDWALN